MPKRGLTPSRAKPLASALPAMVMGLIALLHGQASAQEMRPFQIVGDAIPEPLTGSRGDPARGRAIVVDRQKGLCLLCHTGPFPEQRFQGDLAPDLRGVGARWSEGQLRLKVVDSRRVNADTIMPPYYSTEGLVRVGRNWQGKPVLSAEQIEDVVAYLATLTEAP